VVATEGYCRAALRPARFGGGHAEIWRERNALHDAARAFPLRREPSEGGILAEFRRVPQAKMPSYGPENLNLLDPHKGEHPIEKVLTDVANHQIGSRHCLLRGRRAGTH
jgi:hypothetical protein